MQYHHGGFYAAMKTTYLTEHPNSEFLQEAQLGEQPLQMDMLIKRNHELYQDPIGSFFSDYNVIEYKSPSESPDLLAFDRLQVYALEYRIRNGIERELMTTSLFRPIMPRKLISDIKRYGCLVEQRYPGVYLVTGRLLIPMQIVVTRELPTCEYTPLKIINREATRDDLKAFLAQYGAQGGEYVSEVLRISASMNVELFEELRREDSDMKDAIEYIFRDEFQAERNSGRDEGRIEGRIEGRNEGRIEGRNEGKIEGRLDAYIELIKGGFISVEKAAEMLNMTVSDLKVRLSVPAGQPA